MRLPFWREHFRHRQLWIIIVLAVILTLAVQAYAHALHRKDLFLKKTSEAMTPTIPVRLPDNAQDEVVSFLQTNEIETLEEYIQWMEENMNYVSDKGDIWSDPIDTLNRRQGDCEDLAFLNAAVLKHFGYTPRVLAHGNLMKSHAFCIFKKDGRFHVFDNTDFYNTKATSLVEFAVYLGEKHDARFLLELNLNPRKVHVLFLRKS